MDTSLVLLKSLNQVVFIFFFIFLGPPVFYLSLLSQYDSAILGAFFTNILPPPPSTRLHIRHIEGKDAKNALECSVYMKI